MDQKEPTRYPPEEADASYDSLMDELPLSWYGVSPK